MSNWPLISVIIATYNRANILRYAIQSVENSTLDNWELIVVGDHCTDDTADVVNSFNDSRIRYVNLARNCGEQSGPHNHGLTLARGKYIAFLNHDDMYFPDHLESCLNHLENEKVDFVWVPCANARVISESELLNGKWKFKIRGVPLGKNSHPYPSNSAYVSSSWFFKRELIDLIGPWHPAQTLFVTPSQDWLFRAWRSTAKLSFNPHMTVLFISGGARHNFYLLNRSLEHEIFAREMQLNPRFREQILERITIDAPQKDIMAIFLDALRRLRTTFFICFQLIMIRLNIHPLSLTRWLKYGSRGGFINFIREKNGLDQLPSEN